MIWFYISDYLLFKMNHDLEFRNLPDSSVYMVDTSAAIPL